MKKRTLKTKKAASHAKASAPARATRCDCCDAAPCSCPESHGHKL
jgi:hypothetical protein